MKLRRFTSTAAAIVGTLLASAVSVQSQTPQTPQPAPQIPDSVRQMLSELQQVQSQLASIQQQTIEANPQLQQQQQAAEQSVRAAMIEANPQIEQTMQRLEQLGPEIQAAQAQQDTARLRDLLIEGQRLQRELQMAQAQAVQRADVAQEVEAYRQNLLAAMKAQDPRTEQLLARMEDLTARIEAAAPQE